MDKTEDAFLPLSGLRIVEVSAFVAVPHAGLTLAQLGAEVIRIDPITRPLDYERWPVTATGVSHYWNGLNKSKKSVVLDLEAREGQALARKIATAPGDQAGILITNLSPEWLDHEKLVAERPDMITVALKGNPDGSPAVDYTINAATGFAGITGGTADVINHALPAWDLVAAFHVVTGVISAERRRRFTGQGALVTMNLADIAFSAVGHLGYVAEVVVDDIDREPWGNYIFGSFGRDFETRDHRRIMVVALTVRQWRSLVRATDLSEQALNIERSLGIDLDQEGDRFRAREEIASALEPWFAARTLEQIARQLSEHRVLWGPYQTFRQLVEQDPRVDPSVNGLWEVIDQPGVGRYPAAGSPITIDGARPSGVMPAPLLGRDTEPVLKDVLGLDRTSLRALAVSRVIHSS